MADWYDPGVGGHRMGDIKRGRIYRLAPPQTPYRIPKYDFNSIFGAIDALGSPNLETRYLAWTSLHSRGAEAESALARVFLASTNPPLRARALWLLAMIDGRGSEYICAGREGSRR